MDETLITRLLTRFEILEDSGCWVWTGAASQSGPGSGRGFYGVIRYKNRCLRVHRLSHEIFIGPIPKGLVVDHLCSNTMCFHPHHIEAVTVKENTQRYYASRNRNGSGH